MSSFTSSFRGYTLTVLLGVALLSISFLASTELLIRTKIIPKDAFSWHLDLFHSGNSTNVVFGDSESSLGVHGLPGFLNLSYPSDTLPIIEVKVRRYFADKKPGKVVLATGPHQFAPYRDDHPRLNTARLFASNRAPYLWMFTEMHRGNVINYWKLFFQRAPIQSKYTFQKDGALTQEDGWMALSEGQRLHMAKKRVVVQKPKQVPSATRSAGSYKSALAFLTAEGADVCVVSMPISSLYRSLTARLPELEEARAFFQSLAFEYGVNYVDMSTVIKDDALFLDADHLNERGALEFAPLLESACFGP